MLVDSPNGMEYLQAHFHFLAYSIAFDANAPHASTATRNHKPNHAELVLSILEEVVIRNYVATTAIHVAAAAS